MDLLDQFVSNVVLVQQIVHLQLLLLLAMQDSPYQIVHVHVLPDLHQMD